MREEVGSREKSGWRGMAYVMAVTKHLLEQDKYLWKFVEI